MDELASCDGCKRHVRAREARCPFCGRAVRAKPRRARMIVGRITRAAMICGASALGGCGEADEAPPPAETVVAPVSEPVTGGQAAAAEEPETPFLTPALEPDTEEEARAERADAEEQKERARTVRRVIVPPPPPCCPAPPYGAPPFDYVA